MDNSKKKWVIALLVLLLLVTTNCSFLFSKRKADLFAWIISKEQLLELKQIIIDAGYEKITKDDYFREGSYNTQYRKQIYDPIEQGNRLFIIIISFKTDGLSCGAYRNFGFTLYAQGHNTEDEINTMEKIIYNKLVEFVGEENIERR